MIFTAVKSRLLAIPSRVSRLLIGKSDFQEIYSLLTREIEVGLTELSTIDYTMFTKENEAYLAGLSHNGVKGDNGDGETGVNATEELNIGVRKL